MRLWIASDNVDIRFWDKDYVLPTLQKASRYCVEDVSSELYEAIFLACEESIECKNAIGMLLKYVLENKGLSQN